MIVGNPAIFAIESGISKIWEAPNYLALGYFVIHIENFRYGVHKPDATLLGCSYDEVKNRIFKRGMHTAPFSEESDAGLIADAYIKAIYAPKHENRKYFNLSAEDFCVHFYPKGNSCTWAPDGDEAFDDSSYILQFDIRNQVRLIGFKSSNFVPDPSTIRDLWVSAFDYYSLLEDWIAEFDRERNLMLKPGAKG